MKIYKLFTVLSTHQNLIFYLFEQRNSAIGISDIYNLESIKQNSLEVLQNFDLIKITDEQISLDDRLLEFLEKYYDIDDSVEISIIGEKIDSIKHNINLLKKYQNKKMELLPKIKRELQKIDYILLGNLTKLRVHIDRVYKSADSFEYKLEVLNHYKNQLDELTKALKNFEEFGLVYASELNLLYDKELTKLLQTIKTNIREISKSLIPLTQDVIAYINKTLYQSEVVNKIIKLKELKDYLLLQEQTNIDNVLEDFDITQKRLTISTKLNTAILQDESFKALLSKISTKSKIKSKVANETIITNEQKEVEFINIDEIHNSFRYSNQHLIEYLFGYNKTKHKPLDTIAQIYCQLILANELEYKFKESIIINNIEFKKVYYANR